SGIVLKESLPFVSRGGVKLAGMLDAAGFDVAGLTAIDIGSSTGGFTDCLLKRGASKVYAVDVGKGILDMRLRNDPRVTVLEERNIRYLDPAETGGPVDLAVIDVSFISLEKVLPRAKELLKEGGAIFALIKPQFEVGKGQVGKGGIVKDPDKHREVVERIKEFSTNLGFKPVATGESPIKGAKGNREFWIFLRL
ncbi:MAG: TlyA family RNA methyltransferase, partial [Deltaproteobacteria bacterium]|nr:TlyA family RNA methyltransferase [Deltaproteobacteria bacterium]